MARSDFFRNVPPDRAAAIEALARVQYELREARKEVLAPYGEADAAGLARRVVAGELPLQAGVDAVKAAVIEAEYATVRTRLAAAIEGVDADCASAHERAAARVEAVHAATHPGGATRRFDALELLATDGTARVVRIAAPGFWALEWQCEGGTPHALYHLPNDGAAWHCDAAGKWTALPAGRFEFTDVEALLDALLGERGEACA